LNKNIIESLKPLETDINSIKLDPRNARKHPVKNLDAIKLSLENYGQRKPIVVNQNTNIIEAGNGLYMAAKALSWPSIAVVFVDDDEIKSKSYSIMDNQSALTSEWDLPVLKDLLGELDTGEFDMNVTGFSIDEIEDLMTQTFEPKAGLTDDDAIPEEVETVCKKGDLWKLGNHRLLCGDSTVITDVERLMGGEKADLILTDPPYGINIVKVRGGQQSQIVGGGGKAGHMYPYGGIKGTAAIGGSKPYGSTKSPERQLSTKGRVGFAKICEANLYHPIQGDDKPFDPTFLLTLSDNQIIFGANYFASKLPDGKAWIAWDKDVSGTFSEVELAWTSFEGKLRLFHHMWSGLRREGNRKDELTKRVHPTQKPVGLFVDILKDYRGDKVMDCYGGSGTCLIACEKLNRQCYMAELSPEYCDIIIKRWEDFTGKKAELING
jgi:16S rRNA G966 N2-methylase RsmD